MFHNWYPKFRNITFKSEVITLPPAFVEYLNADGVFMPASAFPKFECDPYDKLSDDEWSMKMKKVYVFVYFMLFAICTLSLIYAHL